MLITRVELHNIKSYKDQVIEFAPGTNAICGANGSGKSTILESIGFALFDSNPFRRQADMVREGERRGSIAVRFIAGDEREYEVVREFGSSTRYYIHDPELGIQLTQGKTDVQAWLCEHLGVPDTTNLPTLFSDAIGVPQGLLASIFLEGRPERRSKFDRLLRVDEYGHAKDRLLETVRHLKDELNEGRNQITALETRTGDLPELTTRIEDLSKQIATDKTLLTGLETKGKELRTQVDGYEAQREQLTQFTSHLALVESKLDNQRRQVNDAQLSLEKAQKAALDHDGAAAGHQAYEKAGAAIEQLESERKARDELRRARSQTENALTRVESRLHANRDRLKEIEEAEERLRQLEPKVREQETFEAELIVEETRSAQLDQCQRSIKDEGAQLDQTRERIEETKREIAEIAELRAEADRMPGLETQLSQLLDGIGSSRAQLAQVRKSRGAVEGGDCPFLNEPCKNIAEGTSLTDYFDEQFDGHKSELDRLQEDRKDIESKLAVARAASEKVAGLPKLEQTLEWLENRNEEQSCRLEELQKQAGDLANARERAGQIRVRLDELGDHRGAYATAGARAAEREATETSLANAEEEHEQLAGQLGDLDEQLAAYGDLDERTESQRALLHGHQAQHELFLRSQALAQTVPEWETRLETARNDLAQTSTELEEAKSTLERARAGYDADAHEDAVGKLRDARESFATVRERQRHQEEDLESARARYEELTQLEAKLADARRQYAADEELRDFVGYARDTIGAAGPIITRALVASISREADQIFSEIVNDHALRLDWTEEYEIIVEKAGNERTFQQLSGGEQMAAAVAVRLALLREVTSLDIAFFDEPTANLDEERRETLADQLVGIRGFSQIFVISHDDTFERYTDHMIRVHKENGVSRIESQA